MDTPLRGYTFDRVKQNTMISINEFISKKNQTWFKEWFNTTFYQQLYANRSEKEAADFVDALLAELQPNLPSQMLDLGCGTGRHAKRLAAHGHLVTGLDLSPSSICVARKVHTPGTQFYQHDMRLPFCVSRFHFVFSFFTSFGYFNTPEENNDVIANISMTLKPKGILVMDYLNVNYSEDNIVENEMKEIDGIVYNITRWHNSTHFYKHIAVSDFDGNGFTHEYTEKVEKLRLHDFDILLKRHGLQLQRVFGDYQLNAYDTDNSPRLIMIAKKHNH